MTCGAVVAGPPLSIDDPGTLDPRQIELIVAGVSETRNSGTWVLPVQFQYDFPVLRLNAEVRYAALRDAGDEWGYGLAVGYPVSGQLELLAEVHGGATRRFDDETWLYRLGADYAWRDDFHLLVSAGSSISEPGDDDIDLQTFLALQWFH